MSSEAPSKGGKDAKKGAESEKAAPPPLPPTPLEVLHRNLFLLDKFADSRDARFLARVLRYTGFLRTHLPTEEITKAIETYVLDAEAKAGLLAFAAEATAGRVVGAASSSSSASGGASATEDVEMTGPTSAAPAEAAAATSASAAASGSSVAASSTSSAATPAPAPAATSPKAPPKPSAAAQPEVIAYFTLLLLGLLTHAKRWDAAAARSAAFISSLSSGAGGEAARRASLDFFVARAHSVWVTCLQKGSAGWPSSPAVSSAASALLAAYRSAVLRHDDYGTASYLVGALAIMVAQRDYEAAGRLLARASFPEAASSALLARYLYYKGRVAAIALEYSDAHAALMQAIRKAPPAAVGFHVAATRFALLVSLLMGEQPARELLTPPAGSRAAAAALAPYYALAKAVRRGDVAAFAGLRSSSAGVFEADGTSALVARLEATVIKAGLKQIATAYACIGFPAIATKLALSSASDAEFLVAKAIRDGVIDAVIDHDAGVMTSKETPNVYATGAPAEAFHKRIVFALDVHAAAMQSMRFPAPAPPADLQSAEAKKASPGGDEEDDLAAVLEGLDDEDDDEDMM